jgi:CheY-like chemotaxis protein
MLPRALVVEDNSEIRDFIRETLETSGWKVSEAENAGVALKQFRQQHPHLVTLDLIMPINDGFDSLHLARLIKDEAPEVAVLVVSAVASKQDIREFMQKYGFELFDKSDPYLKSLFARINVIFHDLSLAN